MTGEIGYEFLMRTDSGKSHELWRLIRNVGKGLLVTELLGQLDRREQQIVRLRYGFGGDEPMSIGAIAERLELSRERIRQLERRAVPRRVRRGRAQQGRARDKEGASVHGADVA